MTAKTRLGYHDPDSAAGKPAVNATDTIAPADDRPATEYLLKEPASLMDIGIIRVERELQNLNDLFAKEF
jgi:hypothetical protein